MLTWIKIREEALKGTTSFKDYITKRLPEAIKNSAYSIGSGFTGYIASWYLTGPAGFLAAATLFVEDYAYNGYAKIDSYDFNYSDPTLEQLYNYYYIHKAGGEGLGNAYIDKDTDNSYTEINIELYEMDEEVLDKLKKTVNTKNGALRTYVKDIDDQSRLVFKGKWAEAVTVLYEAYMNDPEAFAVELENLYYAYAYGFRKLDENDVSDYIDNTAGKNWDRQNDNSEKLKELTDMVVKAKGYERQQLAAKMVDTLKASSGDLLKEVQKTVQRRAFLRVQKEFFENTLPALNTQPVFHVKDLTLDEDKTFDDSRYCIDWKTIDENKAFKGLYNSDELIVNFG